MAEHDFVATELAKDPNAVIVKQMDEFSHIAWIRVYYSDFRWSHPIARETLDRLVRERILLPAPRLTPERTWIHAQPNPAWAARRVSE